MSRTWVNDNARYPQMPYDLIKEMLVAISGIGLLAIVLAAIFSTPDVPALSVKQVAAEAPQLIVQNALDDLSHQDAISTYGPPYSHTPGAAQTLFGLSPQTWAGVQIPIDSAKVNVLDPLSRVAVIQPGLQRALATWSGASAKQQAAWVSHVEAALKRTTYANGVLGFPAAGANTYGPLPAMLNSYMALARSGLLESAIDGMGPYPDTNRTKSLLLLQDVPDHQYADKLNMMGEQWGVIKETGNYPGAVWLWFYTLLYQIPPFSTSASADLWVVLVVAIITVIIILIPFIPGLRDIPRAIGVYRLIWRHWYRGRHHGDGHI